jgi:hypothetical protein
LHHVHKAQRHLARAIQLDPRFKLVAMDDADREPRWVKVNESASEGGLTD